MLRHGLARRFAFRILSLPGVARSTFRVIVAFGVITALLSAVVSNTATVAMLLPTAVGILSVIAGLAKEQRAEGERFDPLRLRVGVALMLMLAQRRRAADPGGFPAEPDRARAHRAGHRPKHHLLRLDGHPRSAVPGDVRRAGRSARRVPRLVLPPVAAEAAARAGARCGPCAGSRDAGWPVPPKPTGGARASGSGTWRRARVRGRGAARGRERRRGMSRSPPPVRRPVPAAERWSGPAPAGSWPTGWAPGSP